MYKRNRNKILLAVLLLGLLIISSCTGTGAVPRGWAGPTALNGTLFVGTMEGKLIALNAKDGTSRWNQTLEIAKPAGGFGCAPASATVAFYGTPAVGGDLVYIGGYNGTIYAFNASSGALRWVYPRQGSLLPIVGGPVIAQGKLYIGSSDKMVYAVDANNLDLAWKFETEGKIWSTPLVEGNTLYIGSFDKKLYALNVAGGSKKWEPFQTGGAIAATPAFYENTVYFGSLDRNLYALHAASGSLKWKFAGGNWFWAKPLAYNNVIYAASLDGKVYARDARNGDKVAEFDLESPISSSPVLIDDTIIVATEAGKIFSIDTTNHQKKLLANVKELADTDLVIRSPLFASEGNVYVHAQTKKRGSLIIALNAKTGAELWRYPASETK